MLATRPPYECPPMTAGPPRAASRAAYTGMARSARPLGRSIAVASTPRVRRPSTWGRIDAAVPEAPWARRTGSGTASAGARGGGEQQRVQAANQPDGARQSPGGEQRSRDVRRGSRPGVVADREPFVGEREDDLRRDNETG